MTHSDSAAFSRQSADEPHVAFHCGEQERSPTFGRALDICSRGRVGGTRNHPSAEQYG